MGGGLEPITTGTARDGQILELADEINVEGRKIYYGITGASEIISEAVRFFLYQNDLGNGSVLSLWNYKNAIEVFSQEETYNYSEIMLFDFQTETGSEFTFIDGATYNIYDITNL